VLRFIVRRIVWTIPVILLVILMTFFMMPYTPFPTNGSAGWESWVLPAITLGFAPMAMLAQLVRGSMLETLRQDCVRTAKANGLHWRRVVGLHVLRNSLIPAVTAIGPLLGYLIAGSFIVETIFGIPGIGRYFIISVGSREYTVVMGITGLLSMIIIIANLIVDILYGYLDPRTRDVRT
jgi:oligopeptide transport system permease protein